MTGTLADIRTEISTDPLSLGYASAATAARAANTKDGGAADVAVANLINNTSRPSTTAAAFGDDILAKFTATEWAAGNALNDGNFTLWRDRLLAGRAPFLLAAGGPIATALAFLVTKNVLTSARSTAIANALAAGAPNQTRATDLGFGIVTPSDVAAARRINPPIVIGT